MTRTTAVSDAMDAGHGDSAKAARAEDAALVRAANTHRVKRLHAANYDPVTAALTKDGDRLLLVLARRGGWWLSLLGLASLAVTAAQVLLPAAVGRAVDAMLSEFHRPANGVSQATNGVGRWLAGCALLVAVIVCCGAATDLATGMANASVTARLRQSLAAHTLRCGPGLLGSMTAGDTVSRIVGGTAEAGAAPASLVMAIAATIPPLGSVVALGLIDPWLMAAFAVAFPLLALVLRRLVRDSSAVSAGYQRAQAAIAGRLLDALAGARTIAAAGTQDQERQRILVPLTALRDQGDASWRVQARAAAQGMIIAPALQVVVVAVAGIELARHRISAGDLLAASQYAVLAVGIGASIGLVNQVGRARGGARRAAELLHQPPMQYGARALAPGPGELRLRGVTICRGNSGDAAVLCGLDLTIPGGLAVAVVGRSGAGKSTLAQLAGRLADPDQGSVALDGTDLRELSHHALREAVVYAFERPELFGRTPGEAIAFGLKRPAGQRVMNAAVGSQAAGFLARLPHGMRTPLADAPLSGGELQRLGLARAFAHAATARLLILDDATSSLDTVTEMLVSQALTNQMSGRTRLIVAHRVTTAARADLVAWLDGGRIRALAPHRRLWADAEYRSVFGVREAYQSQAC
jgi:ATP-binding cassette, subfamily B, bacterial RamA/AmfB